MMELFYLLKIFNDFMTAHWQMVSVVLFIALGLLKIYDWFDN